ncbi:hypothetical protein G6F65_019475 [Rhizopus arrhizus]|nr:hypothetical protein G6F65_019475 [Rhizopus arrhizus]
MVQVVVPETELLHAGRLAAVVQAGVVQLVGIQLDLAPGAGGAQQCGQHRGVGLPAGGQHEGGFGAFQARQLGLHLLVQVKIAADQARGLGARPVAGCPFPGTLDQERVLGQAQIVVAGKIQHGRAVQHDPAGRRRRGGAQAASHAAGVGQGQLGGKQGIQL